MPKHVVSEPFEEHSNAPIVENLVERNTLAFRLGENVSVPLQIRAIVVRSGLGEVHRMANSSKSQVAKFRDAARSLEADEDEAKFNDVLGKIAKAKPLDQSDKDAIAKKGKDIARGIGNLPDEPKKPRR
jgi:hypothetical protein